MLILLFSSITDQQFKAHIFLKLVKIYSLKFLSSQVLLFVFLLRFLPVLFVIVKFFVLFSIYLIIDEIFQVHPLLKQIPTYLYIHFISKQQLLKMDFIRRIGMIKHRFKVQFFIGELRSNVPVNGNIFIVIKRGEHKETSETILPLDQQQKCDFRRQVLTFNPVTMFYDEQAKKYTEKYGQIRVIFKNPKNEKKLLGKIHFDISQYINGKKDTYTLTKNLQETPEKVQISLQYQIYTKFIGEGSQVSKQKAGGLREKRQSSLSKLAGFVEGIFVHKEKQSQNNSNIGTQPKKNQNTPPKNKKPKQKQKTFKFESQTNSQVFKTPNTSQNNEQNDQLDEPNYQNMVRQKNIVKVKNPDNLTEQQYDRISNKSKKSAKTDQIYFDQKPNSHSTKQQLNTEQAEIFNHLFKKKQENLNHTPNQKQSLKSPSFETPYHTSQKFNQKQIQELRLKLAKIEKNHKQISKQNQNLQNEKKAMKNQIKTLKQEIKKIKDQRTQNSSSIIEPSFSNEELLAKINTLEKEKGQYLINMQSIKQKHKTQINKYKQLLEKDQIIKQEFDSQSKGQVKRFKDQLSFYKNKVEQLTQELFTKNQEIDRLEKENKFIQQEFDKVKNSLQKLKLKICDQVNEAHDAGNNSLIEVLTHINEQYLK